MIIKRDRRKSQQEILGFVVIVMLVVIIGVIFLGISLRKSRANAGLSAEDAEITNFLSASAKYTTDCVLREPFYADIKDVLAGCYDRKKCSDMRDTCSVLSGVYASLLDRTWKAGTDRPIKYTKLGVYYQADIENQASRLQIVEPIESGDSGLCSARKAGKYSQYESPGNIMVELEICH